MDLRIIELFSGIGGMNFAFQESQLQGKVIMAIDINPVANVVYSHNHKETKVLNNNIQKLKPELLDESDINMILMSPPCQPYTRVGNKKDLKDNRSHPLTYIMTSLLPKCKKLQFILMENVKGFEQSETHKLYLEVLKKANFYFREFILSPSQLGIPNTRYRYYCLARQRQDFEFHNEHIWKEFPFNTEFRNTRNAHFPYETIEDILETDNFILNDFYLNDTILRRRVLLMDIVTATSKNSMCFTKAYTHYSEGTGSVYCPLELRRMEEIFSKITEKDFKSYTEEKEEQFIQLLKSLRLRYFTPTEIARLMCFPKAFEFPPEVTNRQKYRLLGNSINVSVVSLLIKLLCKNA